MKIIGLLAIPLLLLFGLAACEPQPEAETDMDADTSDMMEDDMAMAGGLDTTGAAVWAHLQDANYQENWQLWPDKGTFYTGQEPHGMLLTTYLNDVALEALRGSATVLPEGAVVVKENYTPDSTLAAVTVMYKAAAGYNPDHNDWFFSKHLPDGSLDQMNGMALEGRLDGCQNCHGAQSANDYIFTSALN